MLALLALSQSGCASLATQMQVSPDLAGLPWHPVQGRIGFSSPQRFGRWQVTKPAHFTTDQISIGSGAPGAGRAKVERRVSAGNRISRFQFEFEPQTPGAMPWSAHCVAELHFADHIAETRNSSDETEFTPPGYPRLQCTFAGPSRGAQDGTLSLRADFTSVRDSGNAELRDLAWDIRSVNFTERQSLKIPLARFGFEFLQAGRVVAAVETHGAGRVWMQPGLSAHDEDTQAAIMMALLYYAELLALQDA